MTNDQRIQLVQSYLWTSDEQARTILTAPGGFKVLLPESIQLWLYGSDMLNVTLDASPNRKSSEENECDQSNLTEATEPSEAETTEAWDLFSRKLFLTLSGVKDSTKSHGCCSFCRVCPSNVQESAN